MRKAYFVIGPASSGTRFISKLILQHGIYGSAEHVQEFQEFIGPPIQRAKFITYCEDKYNLLVRLSHPHGFDIPSTNDWVETLLTTFDKIFIIVTSRNIWGTVISHIDANHLENANLYTQYEKHNIIYNKYLFAISSIMGDLIKWQDDERIKIIPLHLGDLVANPIQVYKLFINSLDLDSNMLSESDIIKLVNSNVDIKRYQQYIDVWGN